MKELELHAPEKTKIHAQTQQEKKQKFIGRIKLQKGLTCFELNIITGLVQPAKYEQVNANYSSTSNAQPAIKRKLIIQENCIYEVALNLDNAVRKLKAKLELLKLQSK